MWAVCCPGTIQSLFLLRSQEAGSIAPQESGLLMNSWTGKHHNEMRFWHQTWMPIWGHPDLLARSDHWFQTRLSNATSAAFAQGYKVNCLRLPVSLHARPAHDKTPIRYFVLGAGSGSKVGQNARRSKHIRRGCWTQVFDVLGKSKQH